MTVLSPRPAHDDVPDLQITGRVAGTVEVIVDTELDISTLPQLRERLEDALRVAPARLVVDLSGCGFLDAQAMTVLLDVHRQAYRAGGLLTLRGCSAQCLRLLSLAGLIGVFDLEPAEGDSPPRPRLVLS